VVRPVDFERRLNEVRSLYCRTTLGEWRLSEEPPGESLAIFANPEGTLRPLPALVADLLAPDDARWVVAVHQLFPDFLHRVGEDGAWR